MPSVMYSYSYIAIGRRQVAIALLFETNTEKFNTLCQEIQRNIATHFLYQKMAEHAFPKTVASYRAEFRVPICMAIAIPVLYKHACREMHTMDHVHEEIN